jgi:hypothetical protein
VRNQFQLPPAFRLRGWIVNPSPITWVSPQNNVVDIENALIGTARLLVEVEPNNEPSFPSEFTLDGSSRVEWILFTHFRA